MKTDSHNLPRYSVTLMLSTVTAMLIVTISALSHQGATGIVKQRMDMMDEIGQAMKVIGQMIKGDEAFNASAASNAAQEIGKHATMIPEMFPEGTLDKPSEALPAIWENWEEFLVISNSMKTDADALAELTSKASDSGEIQSGFAKLGKSCRLCHKKFRLKKQ